MVLNKAVGEIAGVRRIAEDSPGKVALADVSISLHRMGHYWRAVFIKK
jgi:hypothetical protein